MRGVPDESLTDRWAERWRERPLERFAASVLVVLIAGGIATASTMLVNQSRRQDVYEERLNAQHALSARIEKRLDHIDARLDQLYSQARAQRDFRRHRQMIDHNWEVLSNLQTRLQIVEHTLWPPEGPGREEWRDNGGYESGKPNDLWYQPKEPPEKSKGGTRRSR